MIARRKRDADLALEFLQSVSASDSAPETLLFAFIVKTLSMLGVAPELSCCVNCGKCEAACGMKVDVRKNISSGECIRCGECKKVCPAGAIKSGFIITRSEALSDKRIDNRKGKTE